MSVPALISPSVAAHESTWKVASAFSWYRMCIMFLSDFNIDSCMNCCIVSGRDIGIISGIRSRINRDIRHIGIQHCPPSHQSKLLGARVGGRSKILDLSRAPTLQWRLSNGKTFSSKMTSLEMYTHPVGMSKHLKPLCMGLGPRKVYCFEPNSSFLLLYGLRFGQQARPKTHNE
jgi:hypothetical protein